MFTRVLKTYATIHTSYNKPDNQTLMYKVQFGPPVRNLKTLYTDSDQENLIHECPEHKITIIHVTEKTNQKADISRTSLPQKLVTDFPPDSINKQTRIIMITYNGMHGTEPKNTEK